MRGRAGCGCDRGGGHFLRHRHSSGGLGRCGSEREPVANHHCPHFPGIQGAGQKNRNQPGSGRHQKKRQRLRCAHSHRHTGRLGTDRRRSAGGLYHNGRIGAGRLGEGCTWCPAHCGPGGVPGNEGMHSAPGCGRTLQGLLSGYGLCRGQSA